MRGLYRKIAQLYHRLVRWQDRRNQQKDELSFLPLALEIEEKPPHPIARTMMWLLVVLIVIAVLWACFGKMDVVVTAQGKVVPEAQVKSIQPLEKGVIKKILVKDGQLVTKGQVLIELDQRVTQADIDNITQQRKVAYFMLKEYQSLYQLLQLPTKNALAKVDIDELLFTEALTPPERAALIELIWRKWQAYSADIDYLIAEINAAKAEKTALEMQLEMLNKTLPIISEQNSMYQTLHQNDYGSKADVLQSQKAVIETEQALEQHKATVAQLSANIRSKTSALMRAKADYLAQVLEQIELNQKDFKSLSNELHKYQLMQQAQSLSAPLTGFVQNLSVHTIGAVVTPAQVLLQIIPKDSPLEVNAMISNKDIGYVHEGQKVQVKVDTYPFTEYGLLIGELIEISDDAIEDQNLGLVFKVIAKLDHTTLYKQGKAFPIRSGMTVSVEVKTGERRIIEYFLSPLTKAFKESLHER
ncbi:HlyD family type I secretion periplasmic adaptor subunit [Cysteiniphilum halobium]|uniref:HlyD family type I secretion periplasmic adaptor subunit n=1 Tax=Cysteiniphilum halobium TaxID=2219059 RepID=UPI003F83F06B